MNVWQGFASPAKHQPRNMIPRLLRRGAWLFRPEGRGLKPQWSKDEAGRDTEADGIITSADRNGVIAITKFGNCNYLAIELFYTDNCCCQTTL
jgi:hypothetical protein